MRFEPPAGGLDVPHPRTPIDILLRTLAIQGFAAVAYGHLLYLLGFRRPHGSGPLPYILIPAFLLTPELLILQLVFILLPMAVAPPYRRRVVARFKALPASLCFSGPSTGAGTHFGRLSAHAIFAVLNAVPLAAVLGAYRQRLRMTYHQMTYAGSLGLDHRNGWAAGGALLAIAVTEAVICGLVAVVAAGAHSQPVVERGHETLLASSSAAPTQAELCWPLGGLASVDWPTVAELVYVSAFHQILLGLTNHPVPVLQLVRAWYLFPVVGLLAWYLYNRRRISEENLALCAVMGLVLWTMVSHLWWDLKELARVRAGQVEAYNFRWQVKDQASYNHRPG